MNKLFAGALALGALFHSAPVRAEVSQEVRAQHVQLFHTLMGIGVDVKINVDKLCKDSTGLFSGVYQAPNLIVICQHNGPMNGQARTFSAFDLDTLRHEAHHVVQDCLDGKRDGRLLPLFRGQERVNFLLSYPDEKEDKIREMYLMTGHDSEDVELEIEAFAVAELVDARTISGALVDVCR